MTTFTVYFRSDAGFASGEFDADTPEQALADARQAYENDTLVLWFEPYGDLEQVNEIAVCDEEDCQLALWLDDDLLMRLAARDLLEAAEKVVARWEHGDLAEAVRELQKAIALARGEARAVA